MDLIDISWPNSAFEKYECDSDIKFGVRIDEFSKLIKRADKKDSIEISISEENMLLVTVGKNKKYKIVKTNAQWKTHYQKFHMIQKLF